MNIRVRSYIIFVIFGFCSVITFPEGFAPDTWVRLGKKLGWQTIAQAVVASKRFIFKDSVLSFNVDSGRWEAKKVQRGATIDTNCYLKLWFNGCKECDVMCTTDQKFYSA
ncbi:MAG TPA: hypothetical protein VGT41_04885, partial [Candidatus Babeliales bacterium]|nr:hypothetical protein [Candidatus Babeliales bacterium]